MRELQVYLNVGRDKANEIGEAAGAVVWIGARKLFDKVSVDAYLEELKRGC